VRLSLIEELKPKALELLRKADFVVRVGDVAHALGISWSTARQILTELVLEGEVEFEETTRGRIFRIKKIKERVSNPES